MWAGIIGFVGIFMVIVIAAVLIKPLVFGRRVGLLAMALGALTFLLFWQIGEVNCGVKGYLEIVIAGAILFGCGVIATAVGQEKSK